MTILETQNFVPLSLHPRPYSLSAVRLAVTFSIIFCLLLSLYKDRILSKEVSLMKMKMILVTLFLTVESLNTGKFMRYILVPSLSLFKRASSRPAWWQLTRVLFWGENERHRLMEKNRIAQLGLHYHYKAWKQFLLLHKIYWNKLFVLVGCIYKR